MIDQNIIHNDSKREPFTVNTANPHKCKIADTDLVDLWCVNPRSVARQIVYISFHTYREKKFVLLGQGEHKPYSETTANS